MRRNASALLLGLALSAAASGQCTANGLSLVHQGSRLGDPFSVALSGSPNVSGLLGVDAVPGTITTPIGPVCLGLSPALQLLPFTLDPAGQYALGGMMPLQPGLIGLQAFLQAAAIDASQPSGSALSNSAALTLRPPRVFFMHYGSLPGNQPCSWCSFDALTDAVLVGPITLPSAVADAILIPSLGGIAFLALSSTGTSVLCYDATTGALTSSFPVPGTPYKFAAVGTTVYLAEAGALRSLSLLSGTTAFVGAFGGNPQAIMIPQGSGMAYLRCLFSIELVHLATGLQSSINVGGSGVAIEEWLLQGTTLYTLVYGNGLGYPPVLRSIDTTTHQPLQPAPVTMPFPGPAMRLRYGPGQFGDCLFIQNPNLTPPLFQLNPATLLPINQVAGIPAGINDMALTAGGTEWLLTTCGGPSIFACPNPMLLSLQVPSMTVSTISPVVNDLQHLTSVPSATLRRAFFVANSNVVVPFSTDPATAPVSGVPIPVGSTGLRMLID